MSEELKAEQSSDAKKVPKRIAFVKGRTRARVHKEDEEMVMTVPHLVVREVIAFEIMVIVLANPAKAPWYFLGLQELLHYFPPVVGGVLLPALVVIALVVIPYVPLNLKREGMWKNHPRETLIIVSVAVGAVSVLLFLYHVYAMLIPTLLLYGLMIGPYVVPPPRLQYLRSRPLSWWIMTWFVTIVVVLTAIGTLFRGPGWSWTWPWNGLY